MRYTRILQCNWYRTGRGWGVDQKVCDCWVSLTLQSKLRVFWKKLEYLSYITMYVKCWNSFLSFFQISPL